MDMSVVVRWKSLFAVVVVVVVVLGAGLLVAPVHAQPQPQHQRVAASVTAVGTASPVPVRGDVVGQRGLKVRDVTVGNSGQLVTARVFWNQRMIARKGHNDRFNIRLLAFPAGAGAVPIVLVHRSKRAVPPKIQNVKMKLSRSQATQLRAAGDAVLSVSHQYGRPTQAGRKFNRNYVNVTHLLPGSNRSAPAALEPSTRVGGGCSMIEILPYANLSGCDFSGAHLGGADLMGANLSGANFSGAIMRNVDLSGANLYGAILTGVISGGITGTPLILPPGWALVNGYLVGPTPAIPVEPTPATLSCAAGGVCWMGDTGPGGGTVFYVATTPFTSTESACGTDCLYLEAAPSTWSAPGGDPIAIWGCETSADIFEAVGTVVGTGSFNTNAISVGCLTAGIAATIAGAYNGGGKGDWSLPSVDELNQLCRWAWNQATGPTQTGVCVGQGGTPPVGGFAAGYYWSSSQGDPNNAGFQNFDNGNPDVGGKDYTHHVRPVRAF